MGGVGGAAPPRGAAASREHRTGQPQAGDLVKGTLVKAAGSAAGRAIYAPSRPTASLTGGERGFRSTRSTDM